MADHFANPKMSLGWARHARDALVSICDEYFTGEVIELFTEHDESTGMRSLMVRFAKDLPQDAFRKAREAVVLTKETLDQSVHQAFVASKATVPRNLNFPFANNPQELEDTLERKRFPTQIRPPIRRLMPFPVQESTGYGDDLFVNMSKISNLKHTIGIRANVRLKGYHATAISGSGQASMGLVWDPQLNQGRVMQWLGDRAPRPEEFQFSCDVLFAGPRPVNAVIGINHFINRCEILLSDLEQVVSGARGKSATGPVTGDE